MRMLILGAVSANGGDAAILAAQVQAVRGATDEEVAVDVVDHFPAVTRRVVDGIESVVGMLPRSASTEKRGAAPLPVKAWRRLRRAVGARRPVSDRPVTFELPHEGILDLLTRADVVLYTGGTSLVEHYPLGEKLVQLRLAVLMGKPLVLGTQSLGPFERPEHVDMVRQVVAGASAVLLRDQRSLTHLADLGVDLSRAHVLPDVVFSLAEPGNRRPDDGVLRIAVSTRAWAHYATRSAKDGHARYSDAVRDAVTWLVRERSAEVTFLSTCQGVPEYWIDDSRVAVEIAQSLPPDVRSSVTVRRDHVHPAALQEEYGSFDLVLATRMHAAILALNAGTPVVAVAYEFKTLELFRGLGLAEYAHDIEDVTGQMLIDSLDAALTASDALRTRIAESVLVWRDEAARLGDYVVEAARPNTSTAP